MDSLMKLINTPVVTVIIGFLMGVFYNMIEKLYKERKKKIEFEEFKEMIRRDYIRPINETIDSYSKEKRECFEEELGRIIKRLKYLKEEEIVYMSNSSNKFKKIREIELSMEYIGVVMGILKYYSYVSMEVEKRKKDYKKDEIIIKEGLLRQKEEYLKTREGYADLKTDNMKKIDLDEVKKELEEKGVI